MIGLLEKLRRETQIQIELPTPIIMPPPHLTLAKPKNGSLKVSVHIIDII